MKINYIPKFFSLFALIFSATVFLSSCTERIDIDLDESYARLVVDGTITTEATAHTIRLTRTTSYYYAEPAPGVSGATVTIDDGESTITLTENETGVYLTPPDYQGIPGRTYKLNISLAAPISGHTDFEATSFMNPVVTLDSIKAVYHEDWGKEGFYELTCYVLDPPTTDFYMFDIYKNGILLTDTLNKVFVTDDRFYNGNYTNGIGVGYLDQYNAREKVNPGDVLSVGSAKITENYFRFISQLQIQSGFQTPLFSGPPANVAGNISNGAIGFFATYPVSFSNTIAPVR